MRKSLVLAGCLMFVAIFAVNGFAEESKLLGTVHSSDGYTIEVYGDALQSEPQSWSGMHEAGYERVMIDNPKNLPVSLAVLATAVDQAHYNTGDGNWKGSRATKIKVFPARDVTARQFLWIFPVIASGGEATIKADGGKTYPLVWAGNYIFDVKTDGGETAKKFIEELKEFGGGVNLLVGAKFRGDRREALAFRKIVISGAKMTITRGDGEEVSIEPKDDYFRRALYPVEPTAKNNWSGWPN